MTRVVSVGRSKGPLLFSALGIAFITLAMTGCPGSLDPSQFPEGTAGSSGSAGAGSAGQTGTAGAGTAGATGTAGGAPANLPGCDVSTIVTTSGCSIAGVCHGTMGSTLPAANFDMSQTGWETHLVGVVPKGGGMLIQSICGADANFKNVPYINKNTYPATGLLLTKLKMAACNPKGSQMPQGLPALSTADMKCFQDFADKLANTP